MTDILIATMNRNHLLKWNLESLQRQRITAGVIVLDDGFSPDGECKELANKYGARYIHTGVTKEEDAWRVPGFPVNIGIKQSSADNVIISCAEMFHVGNTVEAIESSLAKGDKVIATVDGRFDDGSVLKDLESGKDFTLSDWESLDTDLISHWMPYFLGIPRKILLDMGGYDEDFLGITADDNDLRDRLLWVGCKPTHRGKERNSEASRDTRIIHLWHPPMTGSNKHGSNRELWHRKRATRSIIRNQNREWGKLP